MPRRRKHGAPEDQAQAIIRAALPELAKLALTKAKRGRPTLLRIVRHLLQGVVTTGKVCPLCKREAICICKNLTEYQRDTIIKMTATRHLGKLPPTKFD